MKTLNKDTHYLTEHTGSGQKDLAKAVLLRAFLDSVGHIGSHGAICKSEIEMLQDQAKNFINPNKKQFKKFETLPRCVDLFFPNRFS